MNGEHGATIPDIEATTRPKGRFAGDPVGVAVQVRDAKDADLPLAQVAQQSCTPKLVIIHASCTFGIQIAQF